MLARIEAKERKRLHDIEEEERKKREFDEKERIQKLKEREDNISFDKLVTIQRESLLSDAYNGHYENLKRNLRSGGDLINWQNENGRTALMFAANMGQTKCVELLLEHNAKLDLQDEIGRTALMHAAVNGKSDSVHLIITKGANKYIKNMVCN
jgi:ankyrin repeat protein